MNIYQRELVFIACWILLLTDEIVLYNQWRPKVFFEFEIIINLLVSSFRFILICVLRV